MVDFVLIIELYCGWSIELVRRFSKEIEYCPENMERFEKCCTEQYEDLLNSMFNLCSLTE